jgi:hypothetical protein
MAYFCREAKIIFQRQKCEGQSGEGDEDVIVKLSVPEIYI